MKSKKYAILTMVFLLVLQCRIFAISPNVSLSLVEDFEKFEVGSNANFYILSDVAVKNENGNNHLEFFSDNAKPSSATKTVRPMGNAAVLEFKIKDLDPNANFALYLTDEKYSQSQVCFLRQNSVNIGEQAISFESDLDWVKLVLVFDLESDKCSVVINDGASVDNLPLSFKGEKVCGAKWVLTGEDDSVSKIDDVRLYAGKSVQEEYNLLNIEGKANYMMKDSVALMLDYELAISDNSVALIDETNVSVKPFLMESKTFVPLRFISEGLGAEVVWEASEQKVSISLDEITLNLWIGKNEMTVNGETKVTDTAPILYEGRTFVPLRLVSEALLKTVTWDQRGLIIVSNDNSVNTVEESEEIKKILIKQITGSEFVFVNGEKIQITSSIDNIRMKKIDAVSIVADYEPEEENPAVNAIDGDLSTRWASDKYGTNIILDLGEEKQIFGYALAWMNGSKRVNYYSIQYSVDGQNWTQPIEKGSSGLSDIYEFYQITPVRARYVRYNGFGHLTHEGVQGVWNSVNEFVVFEEE